MLMGVSVSRICIQLHNSVGHVFFYNTIMEVESCALCWSYVALVMDLELSIYLDYDFKPIIKMFIW